MKRIGFTLFVAYIYRIGCHIVLPGINIDAVASKLFSEDKMFFFSMLNMLNGNSFKYMSIFSLSVVPAMSANMLFKILSSSIGVPFFINLKKQGAAGRAKSEKYMHWMSFGISFSQALFTCAAVMTQTSAISNAFYLNKWFFLIVGVPTLMCGSMLLMWLGSQMSKHGFIGNSLFLYWGGLSSLPYAVKKICGQASWNKLNMLQGMSKGNTIYIILLAIIAIIIIYVESLYRKIDIQYSEQQIIKPYSTRIKNSLGINPMNTHKLPIKINPSGIIAPIIAGFMLGSFGYLKSFFLYIWNNFLLVRNIGAKTFSFINTKPFLLSMYGILSNTNLWHFIGYSVLLILCVFIYTPVVFDPWDIAEDLKKRHACIPGILPGYKTATYIMSILDNLMYLASIYILVVCLFLGRDGIISYLYSVDLSVSGTSLLIICTTPMELISSIKSHLKKDYSKIIKSKNIQF